MIKVTIKNNIKFPEFTLQEDLEHIAKDIVIKDLVRNIDLRASVAGGALPFNSPETIKRKGHDHQLVDTGELRNSFYYKTESPKKVVVTIKDGRKEIGGYLQSGVGKAHKQYIFFGVSEYMEKESIKYIINRIKGLINGKRA